jgi:hypothetical protein
MERVDKESARTQKSETPDNGAQLYVWGDLIESSTGILATHLNHIPYATISKQFFENEIVIETSMGRRHCSALTGILSFSNNYCRNW